MPGDGVDLVRPRRADCDHRVGGHAVKLGLARVLDDGVEDPRSLGLATHGSEAVLRSCVNAADSTSSRGDQILTGTCDELISEIDMSHLGNPYAFRRKANFMLLSLTSSFSSVQ